MTLKKLIPCIEKSVMRLPLLLLSCFFLLIVQYSNAQKTAEEFFVKGKQKLKSLDFNGAIADFTKAIELKSNYPDAYIKRAYARDGLEDYKGAINDYNKAIELHPDWTEAYLNRGFAKYYLRDFEGGCADFSKAGKLGDTTGYSFVRQYCKDEFIKKEAEEYYKDGVAKFSSGKYEEAIVLFGSAISVNSSYSDAYFYRAKSKNKLHDYRGAINDYSKVTELKPDYAKAYYNRANARCEIEDYENAVYDYTKAVKLDTKNSAAYFNRGNAKFKLGEKESACNDWSKAGELGEQEAYTLIKKYCK